MAASRANKLRKVRKLRHKASSGNAFKSMARNRGINRTSATSSSWKSKR